MKKIILSAILSITAVAQAADPGVTDKEVVIGAHAIFSGPFAMFGVWTKATQAYFDKINADGGVHGRKIKYIAIDTQSIPPKTAQGVKKLVEEDNVFALVGSVGLHAVVNKYLIEKGVPDLYHSDQSEEFYTPVKKTVFTLPYSFSNEGRSLGEFMFRDIKGKKLCGLLADNNSGDELLMGVKEAVEKGNEGLKDKEKIKIGKVERVNVFDPQANTQIASLKKENCDAVILNTVGGLTLSAITYATSLNFKPKWYMSTGNAQETLIPQLPEAVRDGLVSSNSSAIDESFGTPGWGDMVAFMKKNSLPVTKSSIAGYTVGEHFVEVLNRAGKDLTREKLITAAESLKGWKCSLCLLPRVTTPTEHSAVTKASIVVSKGGKWVLQN